MISDADITAQEEVFAEALATYISRSESYGQVWKQYGALSNLLSAARKIDRLMEVWWHGDQTEMPAIHKDALDDAQDALNYLAFFIRNARQGNLTGERPERMRHPVFGDADEMDDLPFIEWGERP